MNCALYDFREQQKRRSTPPPRPATTAFCNVPRCAQTANWYKVAQVTEESNDCSPPALAWSQEQPWSGSQHQRQSRGKAVSHLVSELRSALHEHYEKSWETRHHVNNGNRNSTVSPWQRQYFDELPKALSNLQEPSTRRPASARGGGQGSTSSALVRSYLSRSGIAFHNDNGVRVGQGTCAEVVKDTSNGNNVRAGQATASASTQPSSAQRRPSSGFKKRWSKASRGLALMNVECPTLTAVRDFYVWCLEKFHNPVRAWRMLDTDLSMTVSSKEFLLSCKEHGFHGDARKVFHLLDRDGSGILHFHFFDASSAKLLLELRTWIYKNFGNVKSFFNKIDTAHNHKLSLEEFQAGAKRFGFGSAKSVERVFQMVDFDRSGDVLLEEMEFIRKWNPPPWVSAQPDQAGADEFKRNILAAFNDNWILAWRKGLDQDGSMMVSYTEFLSAVHKIHDHHHVMTPERIPGIWKALDDDLSGMLSLAELDDYSFEILVAFTDYCIEAHGSVHNAMVFMDKNKDNLVSKKEFRLGLEHSPLGKDDIWILFEGLDVHHQNKVHVEDLTYLDRWDLDTTRKEKQFWQQIASNMAPPNASVQLPPQTPDGHIGANST